MKSLALIVAAVTLLLLSGCDYPPSAPKQSTVTDNVVVLDTPFVIESLKRERTVRLYLPPGYGESDRRYPVLYMHDGQNLFDDATSYAGEWQVDEALNRLAAEHDLHLIVVGIDNGQEHRMNEYSPWINDEFGAAEGAEYMDFVSSVLKPYIDQHYATIADREHTGIMGSSMGGLISHYAALAHADTFSKIGIFSPSYWFSEKAFSDTASQSFPSDTRFAFLVGEKEGEQMVADMQRMVQLVRSQNHPENNIKQKVVADAEHNEAFWASEFSEYVRWLYNK